MLPLLLKILVILYRNTGGLPRGPGISKPEDGFVFHIKGIVHDGITAHLLGLLEQGLVTFAASQYSAEPEFGLACGRDTAQDFEVTACQLVLGQSLNKTQVFDISIYARR